MSGYCHHCGKWSDLDTTTDDCPTCTEAWARDVPAALPYADDND